MEQLYKPKKFGASDNICLRKLFEEAYKLDSVGEQNFERLSAEEQNEVVLDYIGVSTPWEREGLVATCSIDLLNTEGEGTTKYDYDGLRNTVRVTQPLKITKSAKILDTVQVRHKYHSELDKVYVGRKANVELHECDTGKAIDTVGDLKANTDFAVAIRIYKPFLCNVTSETGRRRASNLSSNLKFSHEIIALGSNTLAELRDEIRCYADKALCVELETSSNKRVDPKSLYPSGFLFIDDTFYNDMRQKHCIDYSEVILNWAAQRNITSLQVKSLADTCINELTPRFGYPYVYQHQGNCEHIFVFADAWCLSTKDNLVSSEYPMCTGVNQTYIRLCTVCNVKCGKWICLDSDQLPEDHMLLCDSCFRSIHYCDGKKIGSFKAYPYSSKNGIF